MMKGKIALDIVIFCLSIYAQGQDVITMESNDRVVIKSKVLNEDRVVFIRTPTNYNNSTGTYPVAYMLDGQPYRVNLASGILENLFLAGFVPEMILVSIPNTQRQRDMTPGMSSGQSGSGGADAFLQFLETELIPTVETRYRVQPHRTIMGHSLSGLFVIHAFASRPEVFNAYIAASPHLQWDNYSTLNQVSHLNQSQVLNKTLFVALGNEPDYAYGVKALSDTLEKLCAKCLDYEFRDLPDENHSSVNIPVFHLGLKKVWRHLYVDRSASSVVSSSTLSKLESHYNAASKTYGYQINIPEEFLVNVGRRLIRQNDVSAALLVFEKCTKLYPSSASAYHSFAKALEDTGELTKAKENLEIAVRLAKQRDAAVARAINEDLKRLVKKLNDQK